jgi:ribose transport system substrate-binding protein
VKIVGFDGTAAFVQAMRAGQLHGFVLQNPFRMAALSLETMVDHLLGKAVSKRIDTGAIVVTLDNLETPETQELLKPPLDTYLKPGE